MPTFNTYQQPAAETPLARKWFIRALIASLVIHAVLFAAFRSTKLESFTPYTERLVPRNFSLGRVTVDEKTLADEPEQKQDAQPANTQPPIPQVNIPSDKPSADPNPQDTVFKPTAPEAAKPIATDNPKVTDTDLKSLAKMEQNVSKELDNDLTKVNEQLIGDKTPTSSKSVLKFSENTKPGAPGNPASNNSAIPGTKSLDEALSSTGGGLQSGDTIGIRGGALFAYDSSDLHPDATTLNDLQKLAAFVKQHSGAALIINGYADSIGSITDPQYNKDLSQRRADAVKAFFQSMGIDGSQMQSVGNGSTKFIDPPTYDPAKQAMEPNNRRVEIVLTFPH